MAQEKRVVMFGHLNRSKMDKLALTCLQHHHLFPTISKDDLPICDDLCLFSCFTSIQECPQPCDKMLVYFGFPFFANTEKPRGYVKIYLKRMVKEIEDHQDYTMLRCK